MLLAWQSLQPLPPLLRRSKGAQRTWVTACLWNLAHWKRGFRTTVLLETGAAGSYASVAFIRAVEHTEYGGHPSSPDGGEASFTLPTHDSDVAPTSIIRTAILYLVSRPCLPCTRSCRGRITVWSDPWCCLHATLR